MPRTGVDQPGEDRHAWLYRRDGEEDDQALAIYHERRLEVLGRRRKIRRALRGFRELGGDLGISKGSVRCDVLGLHRVSVQPAQQSKARTIASPPADVSSQNGA